MTQKIDQACLELAFRIPDLKFSGYLDSTRPSINSIQKKKTMKSLKPECHELAEHILRMRSRSTRMLWLIGEIVETLKSQENINKLTSDYCAMLESPDPEDGTQ